MDRKRKETKTEDRVREQPVTYDMYAAMPDDGLRYEIFDGKLELMTPGPTVAHQSVSGELGYLLKTDCKSDYVVFQAPLDVILSPTNVVQPDILMIHRSRLHIVSEHGIEGAPDLVVEIVSPGSRRRDKVIKLKLYAEHGVPEYWVVDAESRTMERYELSDRGRYELASVFEGDEVVESDKLPCVSFPLRDIFRELRS